MSTLVQIEITPELQQEIRSDLAWHYRIIPKEVTESVTSFYIDEEQDQFLVQEELVALLGVTVELIPVSKDILRRIQQ